jgi:hypothetical protein
MEEDELPSVALPTATLLSFMLWILSWELTCAMFLGRWLFGPQWFGPHREWAALGVSVALSIYLFVWGRAQIRQLTSAARGRQLTMTWGQSLLVVGLVVLEGVFATWLFVHGRG